MRLELPIDDQSEQPPIMDTGCYRAVPFLAHRRTSQTTVSYELLALGCAPISLHHLADESVKLCPRPPAEALPSLAGITEEGVHLRWSEIAGIDGHHRSSVPTASLV